MTFRPNWYFLGGFGAAAQPVEIQKSVGISPCGSWWASERIALKRSESDESWTGIDTLW